MKNVRIVEVVAESLWSINVDGKLVDTIRDDQFDIREYALNPLWEALGVDISFENIPTQEGQ